MRKITEESVNAFMNARKFKKANMEVEVLPNVTILKQHGNKIAYRYNNPERTLSITNAGWQSVTTKERLNAIPGVNIHQKNWVWYLNGEEWDGSLINIREKSPPKKETSIFDSMNAFLVLVDIITSKDETLKDRVAYKERIVFATMRNLIPQWEQPSDWNELTDEKKMERLEKIEEIHK